MLTIAFLFAMADAISAQTFSNTSSISIPNSGAGTGAASLYPAPITVSGVGTQLTAISVTLNNFSHAYPADVDVLLVGPNGQNVMLMSDVGTYFPASNLTFTFDNSSGNVMPSGAQLVSGTFAPTNFDPTANVDGFPAPAPLVEPCGHRSHHSSEQIQMACGNFISSTMSPETPDNWQAAGRSRL